VRQPGTRPSAPTRLNLKGVLREHSSAGASGLRGFRKGPPRYAGVRCAENARYAMSEAAVAGSKCASLLGEPHPWLPVMAEAPLVLQRAIV
jgi:hypothetical protein